MIIITGNPNLAGMFPKYSMFCAYKRFPNLKELIVRADHYSIKPLKEIDQDSGCIDCMKWCDSCKNFVDHISSFECFATKKNFKIRRYLTCTTPNMIYLAYCTKCGKQGVGSNKNWKPRLSNYKSHIKKKVKSWSIVKHFIDSCTDTVNPSRYLIVCVTNTEDSSKKEIDDLLLEKENFRIGTWCTIHKGLNNYHDWKWLRRNQKFNVNDW